MASILPVGSRWRAQVRKRGQSIAKTFKTKGAAEARAREKEVEIENGQNAVDAATVKVGELVRKYRTARASPRADARSQASPAEDRQQRVDSADRRRVRSHHAATALPGAAGIHRKAQGRSEGAAAQERLHFPVRQGHREQVLQAGL